MIYLDSSVLLAQILGEDRQPPESLWQEDLVASRLLEYEVWVRLHARRLGAEGEAAAETALAKVEMYELTSTVLARALRPFPLLLRTLDALHLATMEYLRQLNQHVALASYDRRLLAAAESIGIEAARL